jgi:hypothetical protein
MDINCKKFAMIIEQKICFSSRRDPLIDLYSVTFMWYSPIALGTVLLVGIIVSYLTHPLQPHEIDPKLIIPVSDVFCCFLPKRWREWLRCGVDYEAYHKKQVYQFEYFAS